MLPVESTVVETLLICLNSISSHSSWDVFALLVCLLVFLFFSFPHDSIVLYNATIRAPSFNLLEEFVYCSDNSKVVLFCRTKKCA